MIFSPCQGPWKQQLVYFFLQFSTISDERPQLREHRQDGDWLHTGQPAGGVAARERPGMKTFGQGENCNGFGIAALENTKTIQN